MLDGAAPRWWSWPAVSAGVIGLDQLSKYVVQQQLTFGKSIAVAPFFDLVLVFNPGAAFSFETQQSGIRWTYRIQPDGTGSLVSESRAAFKERPAVAKLFTKVFLGGVEDHDDELRAGMRQTLERVKQIAET